MPRKNISLIEACGIAQQECRDIANDYAIDDFDLSDWDMYNDNEDGSSDGREYCLLPYHVYLMEEYDLDYGTINYTALDEEGCRCGIIRVVLPKEMNAEQRRYAAHELVKYLKAKGIDAEMPDGEVTVETLRALRAMTPDLDPDAEPVHLYIRLEKPNNEYDDRGRMVFESSLNMSANFEVFALNPKFAEFKNKAYIEINVDFSPAKKWLVNKLSLHIIAKSDEIAKAISERIEEISGERAEHFGIRTPEDAWLMLNKLMIHSLPYGCLWTDKEYFPTTPQEENEFKVSYNEGKRSWTFSPAGWSDPIFEVRIDEWGRPIFSYMPDDSGYPANMECLLSDARTLFPYYYPGWWLLNTIIPEARSRKSKD